MAVQAQYPSNVLLLNRNMQESKTNDYSLQPQPGGYLAQSSTHILFNNINGGNNNTNNNNSSRKRGRDSTTPMHSFSLQPQLQQTQLVDISQLHNHQNVVSTGLQLSFGDHQHQHLQQQQHLHHQQQQQSYSSSSSSVLLGLLSEDVANQIKQQRDEIDQFLQAQGEQLRRTLAEKRQRHYRTLLGVAKETVARRLREKEVEFEKAARRNAELEARAAQLSMEAQVWQAKARAQEAAAATLQAQLQHAIISGGGGQMGEDGTTSSAVHGGGCGGGEAQDAESGYIDPDRVVTLPMTGPVCKGCRRRAAAVVLLPCRHLCVCTECDTLVQACPVCRTTRNSSVEVFLT